MLYTKIQQKEDATNLEYFYNRLLEQYSFLRDSESILLKNLFHLRISLYKQNKEDSVKYYKQVIQFSAYNTRFSKQFYYKFLGLYHYLYGDLMDSLTFYRDAEKQVQDENIEETYYQLALILTDFNQLEDSNFYIQKALDIFTKKMKYTHCINAHLLIAINYRKMNQYNKAITIYQRLINEVQSDTKVRYKVFHNLGLIYLDLKNYDKAIENLKHSLRLKEKENEQVNTLYLLAKAFVESNQLDAAQTHVHKGKKLACTYNIQSYSIHFHILELMIHGKMQTEEFGTYLEKTAIPYFTLKNEQSALIEMYLLLSKHFEDINRYKKAYYALKNYTQLGGVIHDTI